MYRHTLELSQQRDPEGGSSRRAAQGEEASVRRASPRERQRAADRRPSAASGARGGPQAGQKYGSDQFCFGETVQIEVEFGVLTLADAGQFRLQLRHPPTQARDLSGQYLLVVVASYIADQGASHT